MNRYDQILAVLNAGNVTPKEVIRRFFPDITIYDAGDTVKNKYTNISVKLSAEALSLYDLIKGAEMYSQVPQWREACQRNVRDGMLIFKYFWLKEYFILLD